MKTAIHPQLFPLKITCSCGNSFDSLSTKKDIHVEVCNKCHPFYTGEHRFVDTKGRVDTFQKKQQHAAQMKTVLQAKKQKRLGKEEKKVKSLRELLGEV